MTFIILLHEDSLYLAVKLYKSMISPQDRISTIISYNPILELVLDRFELTYQHRDERLEVVCKDKSADVNFFVEILKAFDEPDTFDPDLFKCFDLSVILDYLQKTHVYYIDKRIGELGRSIDQLIDDVGIKNSALRLFIHFFIKYKRQLLSHIELEEKQVFPYIFKLLNGEKVTEENSISLDNFIENHETDQIYNQLYQIRKLIIQQHPDISKTMPFRILIAQLDAFERDLLIHERIEEEVLIPKALELEKNIL